MNERTFTAAIIVHALARHRIPAHWRAVRL